MKNIIFVGGLDSRDKKGFATPAPPGDLNLEQQTDLISKGYGSGANIASFRHNAATGLITQSITDNPGAVVILFSAGCLKSKAIADHLKSINQPLNLLHINEPYTCAPGGTSTANQINAAIALGVPKTNVYSGGYDCAGNNISGHTKLVGRTPGGSAAAHFNSLTPLGKLIASLKTEDPAPVATTTPVSPAQSKSVIATGPGKDFINKFNEELENIYKDATTSLGPWKKAREEAIKITKPRIGAWPVDPAVKTIGDLFAYVFFDLDGANFKIPSYYVTDQDGKKTLDRELQTQYNDWINDMNGGMPLPPTGPLVPDANIAKLFRNLARGSEKVEGGTRWDGDKRNSKLPIVLSPSVEIIKIYNEIKKTGITNPDKYSPGQWWFDEFMSDVLGLNGRTSYLKSDENRSNNRLIVSIFGKKFLDNNKKIVGDPQTLLEGDRWKANAYTISVSKFVKGETVPYPIESYPYDRENFADYGYVDKGIGVGFAKILLISQDENSSYTDINDYTVKIGGGYGGINIFNREWSGLSPKTQYRAGVSSLESLSKDPLFNFHRIQKEDTEGEEINWTSTGTQSKETGVYWNYEGGTASIEGKFEHILLYNAFLEAGDDYKTITIPRSAPKPKEESVTSTLVPTVENKFSGEFTFNVEKKNTFVVVGNQNFTLKIGDLVIEGLTTSSVIDSPKTIDLGDGIIIIDDEESDEDIYSEGLFQGAEEELAQTMEKIAFQQSQLPPDTPPSSVDIKEENINYNDPSFKGEAWKNFDISVVINKINATKFKPKAIFLESLKKVLYLIKNDAQIIDLREGAYLLGTAFGESSYSLQRWEADWLGAGAGIPYGKDGPPSAAINWYKKSAPPKKANYYTLGTDSKGQCFFGRGLIQLTGKANYATYGKLIGVDLVNNGDLAVDPINSYKIASVYMVGGTFKHVKSGDLTKARKSVNGGTNGIDDINAAYHAWVTVLKESKAGAV